jgi:DNA-binding NarL/FixJ family response regulator
MAGFQWVLGRAGYRVELVTLDGVGTTNRESAARLVIYEPASGRLESQRLQQVLESVWKTNAAAHLIACSDSDWPSQIARAMILGARDFLLKSDPGDAVLSAVQRAFSGEPAAADNRINRMKSWLHAPAVMDSRIPELTTREQQVLRHLGVGLSNQEIGQSLQVSVETVKELVQILLRKLVANDRTAAAVKAVRLGLA